MNASAPPCPLLDHPATSVVRIPSRDVYDVQCPICGRFHITGSIRAMMPHQPEHVRNALSWYTRERTDSAEPIAELTEYNFEELARSCTELPVSEKIDRLLQAFAKQSRHPGQTITETEPALYTSTVRASSRDEVDYLITHLIKSGYVQPGPNNLLLTVAGWQRVDERLRLKSHSRRVFVAMSFDRKLTPAYEEGIRPALTDLHLEPVRVDKIHHNEKICDRIIVEVRSCGLLVADTTGHRQGVYFEAGFALGLGKPVIWLCRDRDIGKAHFDTRQYNHIVWSSAAEIRTKLRERLEATVLPILGATS